MRRIARHTLPFIALGLALFAFQTGPASAADGQQLYAKCAGCHGADGAKPALGGSKPLKGQPAEAIASELTGYKSKSYGGDKKAIMEGVVRNLSDEDIKALADYVAKL